LRSTASTIRSDEQVKRRPSLGCGWQNRWDEFGALWVVPYFDVRPGFWVWLLSPLPLAIAAVLHTYSRATTSRMAETATSGSNPLRDSSE